MAKTKPEGFLDNSFRVSLGRRRSEGGLSPPHLNLVLDLTLISMVQSVQVNKLTILSSFIFLVATLTS
jgi:hypothetical protein